MHELDYHVGYLDSPVVMWESHSCGALSLNALKPILLVLVCYYLSILLNSNVCLLVCWSYF